MAMRAPTAESGVEPADSATTVSALRALSIRPPDTVVKKLARGVP